MNISQSGRPTVTSHLHVGIVKGHVGNPTLTTVNQPVLARGTNANLVTTPLRNSEHLKDMQIEFAQPTAPMKISQNGSKKKTTQNLSLTGRIAHPLIPNATMINAAWKTIFARNVMTVAINDQRSMSVLTI